MDSVLVTNELSKHYGKLKAVDKLTLEIPQGSVFGILGPNGSGKTTTLGMILDVISPNSGSYIWNVASSNKESRKKIGSILETPSFYPYLSAARNLMIVAKIKGSGENNIENVLKQVGLYDRRNDAFKTYSLGMKQRLAIASALLTDPPVLILDEPTNGLDPQGIAEIRALIKNIASQGKTILFASHLLDEVQKVCTHFTVLNFGKKIYEGTVEGAMNQDQTIELSSKDLNLLEKALGEYPYLESAEKNYHVYTVRVNKETNSEALHKYLISKGIVLTHLSEKKWSLEQQFLKILENSNA